MNKELPFYKQLIYMVKCLLGIIICYQLYKTFPQYPLSWSMVSVVLVFAPGVNDEQLAYGRIKANIIGSAVGLLVFIISMPELLKLCIGIAFTISINYLLKLTDATRSALAALVIVIMQESNTKSYTVALERAGCVLVGCCVALMITLISNWIVKKMTKEQDIL